MGRYRDLIRHGHTHHPRGTDSVPASIHPVYALWSGSATVADGVEDTINISVLEGNDATVFGTGDSRSSAPTNTSGDSLLLLMKPGIYTWAVTFTTNVVDEWPAESAPWVHWRVETPGADTYWHSWSSPNQSGFSGTWTLPTGVPSPPVFVETGSVGASVPWLNRARITYHGHGAIPTSYLPGPLWGSLGCKFLNKSGADVTVYFDGYIQGVVTDHLMPDITNLI